MPQRIIQPALRVAKNPITLKSLLLFITLSFVTYTVVRDWQQAQASFARFKAIATYTEESRVALEAAKRQNEQSDQVTQNTMAMLDYMAKLNTTMREVADLMKINRERQAAEHQAIMTGNSHAPATSRRRTRNIKPKTCYELRPIQQKYGDQLVTVHIYVKTKC